MYWCKIQNNNIKQNPLQFGRGFFISVSIYYKLKIMKHILNNLSEEEKNSIREKHSGGMKIQLGNFKQMVETKLGDSKPFVSEQPTEKTNENPWANYPCVAKFKDVVSPKGQKSKRGEGIFANTLFFSNGRAMDNQTRKMYFFKCDPNGIIVGEELEGLEVDV